MKTPGRFAAKHSLLITALFLWLADVAAHDFWIEPEVLRPATGADVSIRLREGVSFKGNTLPYITAWFEDFTVTTAAGRQPVESILGDDPAATLTAVDGDMLVGYQSKPSYVELEAEKFNGYLEDEGIAFIRELRIKAGTDASPAPEFFVRCAKALIQNAAMPGALYDVRLGYELELVLQANPAGLAPGDALDVLLLKEGEPVGGLLVQAFSQSAPDNVQKIRTDERGMARVQIDGTGIWLIKAVNIQPLQDPAENSWLSHWASYTFAITADAQR